MSNRPTNDNAAQTVKENNSYHSPASVSASVDLPAFEYTLTARGLLERIRTCLKEYVYPGIDELQLPYPIRDQLDDVSLIVFCSWVAPLPISLTALGTDVLSARLLQAVAMLSKQTVHSVALGPSTTAISLETDYPMCSFERSEANLLFPEAYALRQTVSILRGDLNKHVPTFHIPAPLHKLIESTARLAASYGPENADGTAALYEQERWMQAAKRIIARIGGERK